MKRLFSTILLLTVFSLEAGYYGNAEINTYDASTGNYYKAIIAVKEGKGILSSTKASRRITNIAIYNPETESHKLLFKKDDKRDISVVLFESAYKDQTIEFNGANQVHNSVIKNNINVPQRKPHDKFLLGLRSNNKKITDLWVAKKDGSQLQKLVSVPFNSTWHIDVKNSILRVVSISNQDLVVKNFLW